jgi:hypothetical protein
MQTNHKMNITIETPARRKSGFTGKKQSPNQSLSARINNLARSFSSKSNHLSEELTNFELWMIDNLPKQAEIDTVEWRRKIYSIHIQLFELSETLRAYNNTKPVYLTASPLKNTP